MNTEFVMMIGGMVSLFVVSHISIKMAIRSIFREELQRSKEDKLEVHP